MMPAAGYRGVAVFLLWLLFCSAALGAEGDIYVLNVKGSINPAVADQIKKAVEKASFEKGACLVIELDTPGGLAEAMREIIMSIYASRVPVIVYVSPSGARAASAGVMITMAADIAAMAPATNIGAAHPVGAGGKDIEGSMSDKVVNDMAAQAKSIAERRGRNTQWAEKAVRESASITESEALEKNVIDIIAKDIDDLVAQIDGREVPGKGVLSLEGSAKTVLEENLRTKILKTISNPNIAYILMMIGLAGLYFELSHPGAIFPGVIGGISLILAFFAFQTLPVNYAGVLLIVLAVIFFIMELKVTSYGLLSVAGICSLLLGSLMLFESSDHGISVSLRVLLPTVILVSGFFVAVAGLAFKAHLTRPRTGAGGLIGEIGVVKQPLSPEGKVFVHGELWQATADVPLDVNTRVRVVKVTGLVLEVEPAEDAA